MTVLRHALAGLAVTISIIGQAHAASEFPFGAEMTLEARPQPGSKRIPTLEIDDSGQAQLDLWCKSGKGQFSVANDSVIFMPGAMEDRGCTPERAQLDEALINALSASATWKRQGDFVLFVGPTTLRFRISTN